MKTEFKCSSCGERHEVETFERINVGENPELKEKVKDGSLFIWECPHCGTANLVRNQTLYHDPDAKLMIWVMPAGILPESLEESLALQLDSVFGRLESYTLRRVDEIGSLIEKVNIFDAGLEDTVVEMCKHVTKMELAEKGDSKDVSEAPFKFYHLYSPDNDIEFSYPLDGEMHGVRIGFNVYEDCAGIIRRNPEVKPSSGFSRIDSDWVAGFFR